MGLYAGIRKVMGGIVINAVLLDLAMIGDLAFGGCKYTTQP